MASAQYVVIADRYTGDKEVTGPFHSVDEAGEWAKDVYHADTWSWYATLLRYPTGRGQ